MSRHHLDPRPEAPDVLRGTVGWDRPLQTFFAQIFTRSQDPDDEEGTVFIWHGTEPGELPDAEAALAIVRPYVIVPTDLAERLTAEMAATIGVTDTCHQADVKRRLFGSLH